MADKDIMKIELVGRIDSNNAAEVESNLLAQVEGKEDQALVLDASQLEYISSAGLRILLHLRKDHPELKIVDANSGIYEILEMTGFTEMLQVEKAYREVSVEGCEEIGRGAHGTIYRIDQDNVVKVYNNADALADIQHEREVAKLALILGIPTAISYDVVKIGDHYGSVFELLNASSFTNILVEHPEKFDWCVDEYVGMLKKIHATEVPEGKLPSMKAKVIGWAEYLKDYLDEADWNKLMKLITEVPDDNHMIHGDYHTKNLELQNDEVLIIDMDTLAMGHPIFELGTMFNSFVGFSEYDHEVIKKFQGFDYEMGQRFWHESLKKYLDTDDEARVKEVEDMARIVGYTRSLSRIIRKVGFDAPNAKEEFALWKEELLDILKNADTLNFNDVAGVKPLAESMDIEASNENLDEVQNFVYGHLEGANCSAKEKMQIGVVVEEIFTNIANYAYNPGKGNTTVRVKVSEDPVVVTITFIDHGIPYDPLAKEDPDITLSAEERSIGGLGIFMTKQMMDEVEYEYKDGSNILTLRKNL